MWRELVKLRGNGPLTLRWHDGRLERMQTGVPKVISTSSSPSHRAVGNDKRQKLVEAVDKQCKWDGNWLQDSTEFHTYSIWHSNPPRLKKKDQQFINNSSANLVWESSTCSQTRKLRTTPAAWTRPLPRRNWIWDKRSQPRWAPPTSHGWSDE